jgi:hypothetical protein
VAAQDGEAAVAAVAGERNEHGGQGDGERKTAGDFDDGAEQQHDRRISSSPPGDTHDRGDVADEETGAIPMTTVATVGMSETVARSRRATTPGNYLGVAGYAGPPAPVLVPGRSTRHNYRLSRKVRSESVGR